MGYEASTWNGVWAPKNTPADIVDRLNREINAGLADPTLKTRLVEMGDEGNRSLDAHLSWVIVARKSAMMVVARSLAVSAGCTAGTAEAPIVWVT